MRIQAQKIFWKSYWKVYDVLCNIRPYRDSINRSVDLMSLKPGGEYLDLACGTGNVTQLISARRTDISVVGLDYSRQGLKIAKGKNPASEFLHGDFNDALPFPEDSFDGVLAFNAMYLAEDPLFTLLEIHRVLRPGAYFVMSTPGPKPSILAILKEHLKTCYSELSGLNVFAGPLWSKIVIAFEALHKGGAALTFLPFQIALKLKGGGAASFWPQEKWESIFTEARECGINFTTTVVEPSYAGQNTTFALLKE